ncbi:MAG TPA: hypothetical protein VGH97_17550 [Thermoanaerobaculia bacterium]
MKKTLPRHGDEVESVFDRSRPIIRFALVSFYRLTDEEARGAEEDLRLWFSRLVRRSGGGPAPERLLRTSLVSAACQYGRSFQLWKSRSGGPVDPELRAILAREPEEVSETLYRKFDEDKS